jgi:hypothetical protein
VATEFFWERNELLYRQDLSCTDEIVASGLSIHIGLTVGPTTLQRCQHGDEQSVIDHLIKVISRGNHTLAEIAAHNLHLS